MKEQILEIINLIAKHNEEVSVRFKNIYDLLNKNISYINEVKAVINNATKTL